MEISKISQAQNQGFTSDIKENKQTKTPKQVKNGRKKLALALAGLGATAMACVLIYKGKNKPINNAGEKISQAVNNSVENASEKLNNIISSKTQESVSESTQKISENIAEATQKTQEAVSETIQKPGKIATGKTMKEERSLASFYGVSTDEEYNEKMEKLYIERLNGNVSLDERVENTKDLPNRIYGFKYTAPISDIRVEQLRKLSKEQIDALDDTTIYGWVHNTGKKLANFEFIQDLTPEELRILQQDQNGQFALEYFMLGRYIPEKHEKWCHCLEERLGKIFTATVNEEQKIYLEDGGFVHPVTITRNCK